MLWQHRVLSTSLSYQYIWSSRSYFYHQMSPSRQFNLYPLGVSVSPIQHSCLAILIARPLDDTLKWHHRLGHLNLGALWLLLQHNMVLGWHSWFEQLPLCVGCLKGKHRKTPFHVRHRVNSIAPLVLVHTNLWDPVSTPSLGGSKYCLTFSDDFSKYTIVYCLAQKFVVFSHFKIYKTLVEN